MPKSSLQRFEPFIIRNFAPQNRRESLPLLLTFYRDDTPTIFALTPIAIMRRRKRRVIAHWFGITSQCPWLHQARPDHVSRRLALRHVNESTLLGPLTVQNACYNQDRCQHAGHVVRENCLGTDGWIRLPRMIPEIS